jgi:hypothetical protein
MARTESGLPPNGTRLLTEEGEATKGACLGWWSERLRRV